ncbi:gliding motility-associated C-terminal domain-containing protein [Robertkochia marina]|uniref:Gliding motility-associated C-terminal domain-containing protein n=1 Tax=Robertkochia marina TaxID=1227945 RepID=A0A4S3M2G9_9FLAO|nr:gliding motility-associated C-terminal domain-containing protein [Robertkochia marina]THD69322.1 gliding motility-associated C-terminal domain-containing protein [Robertkochia marina]TRZ47418.1 gliding motility-associated C-terminal domain-containing protein [Robertkochia marina]
MKALQPQRINFLLAFVLSLAGVAVCAAQTLNKPTPDFTYACASASFNDFSISFTWQSPAVASDNQFILELSDANGSFNNPTVLSTLSDKNTTYEFKFNINWPEDTAGDSYKVRVRSTSPSLTSPESDAFSAYYMSVTDALVINNYQEASICNGSAYVLSVDNYPEEAAYNWYKDMMLIPGEKEAFLEVTEPGIYFAEVDYGDYCSVNTASNLVEVYAENSLGITLMGEPNITLCQGETYTLTANINDNTLLYKWYKDGQLVVQNNENTFLVDGNTTGFEGEYYLVIENTLTGCDEVSNTISVGSNGFETGLNTPNGNVLLPGQSITLETTTTATNPTYEWYKDDVLMTGETGSQLIVSTPGSYKAKVIGSGSCVTEKFTPEAQVVVPDTFVVYLNTSGYTECMTGTLNLELAGIDAVSGTETFSLQESVLAGFNYQWTLEGAAIAGETNRTITLSGIEASGNYALAATINGTAYTSSVLNVKMGITESPVITAPVAVTCNDGTMLDITSNMTATTYTYTWYRNGVAMTEASPNLQTTLPGTYRLEVGANGCSVASNEVTISEINQDMVQLDVPQTFSIPEGETRVVTATGGDSYIWYDAAMNELSTAASVELSLEGQYMVRAVVGNCEISKTVELTYQLSYSVPNAVTPNGDGFNDLWILPSAYAYQPDIQVTIYDESGIQVFNVLEYQNNWPQSSDNMNYKGGRPPIYYYTISKGKDIVKRGTITVIK